MKKIICFSIQATVCLAILAFLVPTAKAANPATINVTVTVQNLSVSATGPIAFGTVAASSATVSSGSSTVTNDGNVTETYSLNLTDPVPPTWTAVQALPGDEEYCLSAMFNTTQPASGGFTYANHALSTTPTACSATKFAGDQTGLSVLKTQTRSLWFKFEAPSSTTVTTEQTIVVTITASAG